MVEVTGDAWKLAGSSDGIVVPTNIGWKGNGDNVMGRGIARQAASRFHDLPRRYGAWCKSKQGQPMVYPTSNTKWCRFLVLLPVKPLVADKPYLSWKQPADVDLIRAGLIFLSRYIDMLPEPLLVEESKVFVPLLGCGNGGLHESVVIPLMDAILTDPRFIRVRYDGAA